jgi:hypothetical protein
MRTVLVWVIYGPGRFFESQPAASFVFNATAMLLWFAALIYLSILWKKEIDGRSEILAQYLEDVAYGKRPSPPPLIRVYRGDSSPSKGEKAALK